MEPDAAAFLKIAGQFQLGNLETEQSHPDTVNLATWAREDPAKAVDVLREVDFHALEILRERAGLLQPLSEAIHDTLRAGDRVYLCGCGATGRLSLSLELFCRAENMVAERHRDQVLGFMAGGDAALIRSIESFEDRPAYGERQLTGLGFGERDFLIATTEAGETPFVIGAAEAAARLSCRRPFFLYGNPDELLRKTIERSTRVLDNTDIHKINLSTGPMALSGSTRMQASTVLMAAIGFAFLHEPTKVSAAARQRIDALSAWWRSVSPETVAAFVEAEAAIYEKGEFVLYEPGPFGITVLTDTTERSPTFALVPFERVSSQEDKPSLCYLHLPGTADPAAAWEALLQRHPRTLEWGELKHLTGGQAIRGFDFSDRILEHRRRRTHGARHHCFRIENTDEAFLWRLDSLEGCFPCEGLDAFGRHLALKMLLNVHSTLVMGRLGRYEGNVMTYVCASNNKLVDRVVRYTRQLLQRRYALEPSYDDVVRRLFEERDRLRPDQSIVLALVEHFRQRARS